MLSFVSFSHSLSSTSLYISLVLFILVSHAVTRLRESLAALLATSSNEKRNTILGSDGGNALSREPRQGNTNSTPWLNVKSIDLRLFNARIPGKVVMQKRDQRDLKPNWSNYTFFKFLIPFDMRIAVVELSVNFYKIAKNSLYFFVSWKYLMTENKIIS